MAYTSLVPVMPTENEATARHFGGATTDRVTPVTALQIGQLARDQFAFEACSTLTEWSLNELDVVFEPPAGIIWQYMRPRARPSFTHGLLRDLNAVADGIEGAFSRSTSDEEPPARFVVSASRVPGIFNLGGDLSLFLRLIETRDRDGLRRYAHSCARGQYRLHSSYDSPVTLVALVQGDALGGGFEAILAHDIVVAERQSQFGLPEVLFNLFPGMGAYSFLSRRLGAVQAEKMILSGKVYSAEDLHEMGIVDHLAETGQGEEATYDLIAEFNRSRHARQAVLRTRKIVNKVTVEELIDVADVWVDTALQLGSNDLRRMAHLARAQDRRWSRIEPSTRLSA